MESFKLREDEILLLQHDDAVPYTRSNKGISKGVTVQILLTNKNIYIQYPRKRKEPAAEVNQIPLDTISVVDGSPQIYVRSELGLDHHLIITTETQEYDFWMAEMRKANVQKWVDYITKILTENMQVTTNSDSTPSLKEFIGPESDTISCLDDDEEVFMQHENVEAYYRVNNNLTRRSVCLYLTNKNIFVLFPYERKKRITRIIEIPLDSITIIEGCPQVFVQSQLGLDHHLVITTKSQQYDFWMAEMRKASVQKWVDTINGILLKADVDANLVFDSNKDEITIDVELDDDSLYMDEQPKVEKSKKHSFFSDAFSDTKSTQYDTNGYVIKFEKNISRNSWQVYNNDGACIYKIKRAFIAMRPCLKVYDNREKQYVAEIKKHINPLPHVYDSFVWIVRGETLGIVTLNFTGKLLDRNYNADFLGWSYKVRPTKSFEILKNSMIIAKPLSTSGANPEPFEYYDKKNELAIVMMFYTNYLDTHENRASLGDRIFNS